VDENPDSRPETTSSSRKNSGSGSARPITSYGRKPMLAQQQMEVEKPEGNFQSDFGGEGIFYKRFFAQTGWSSRLHAISLAQQAMFDSLQG